MTEPPLQIDRATVERLAKEDATWVGRPFDVAANPSAIQANTRAMVRILRDTAKAQRASLAAAFAEDLLDTIVKYELANGPDANRVACSKGCFHCCTTYVSATIPEVLRLAGALRADREIAAQVYEASARAQGIPQHRRETQRIACPVLREHACSGYGDRPLVCRALMSTSLETCIRILTANSAEPMTHVAKTMTIRTFVMIMMKAAMTMAGLPSQHVELTQALAIALAAPDAEARWLAGDSLFNAVPVDVAEQGSSHLKTMVDTLVRAVSPTL